MLSFEGNTAPYLQYAYTRIRSIFRKAGIEHSDIVQNISIGEQQEKALALKLLQFGEVVQQVADDAYPHVLCNYLYELASVYMVFYEHCPVLKEGIAPEVRNSRLAICQLTSLIMAQGLDLLGIDVMEQM